jgi:hypothetical protein
VRVVVAAAAVKAGHGRNPHLHRHAHQNHNQHSVREQGAAQRIIKTYGVEWRPMRDGGK